MAMTQPGMFLSQPPIVTSPSKPSAATTVSIESAMTSRETSEYRMPGVPFAMPSETVIVLKSTLFAPAPSAPAPAWRARPSMCMLHGVTMFQVEAMPTCGFAKSASVKPDGAQHGAARRLRKTVDDHARVPAGIDAGGILVLISHVRRRCAA